LILHFVQQDYSLKLFHQLGCELSEGKTGYVWPMTIHSFYDTSFLAVVGDVHLSC